MPIDRANITFWIDGVSSEELGIKVSEFPTFSGAKPRVTKYSIPGRNGDLTYWDGSYENTSVEISCFVIDAAKVELALTAVNGWLTDCSYRKFVISSEPGRYRMARITNAAEIAIKMGVLAPFAIELDCKPQRFFASETPLLYTSDTGEVYNATGFDALPIMRCYFAENANISGTGVIQFSNSYGKFRLLIPNTGLSGSEWLEIDMETKSARNDAGESISVTTDSTGFPTFCNGVTTFSIGNSMAAIVWFSKIELYPRWWTL